MKKLAVIKSGKSLEMVINLMEKEINFKIFDGRHTHYLTAAVKKVAEHKGHEIYKDKDEWLYVECKGNWQYFGTMREAKKFINNTIW